MGWTTGDASIHPVPLIHLFYETFWDVPSFVTSGTVTAGPSSGPLVIISITSQALYRLLISAITATGYSFHADFHNGWDVDVLQNTIDWCGGTSDQLRGVVGACPVATVQDQGVATKCKSTLQVTEATDGPFTKLPGSRLDIILAPVDATLYSESNCLFIVSGF